MTQSSRHLSDVHERLSHRSELLQFLELGIPHPLQKLCKSLKEGWPVQGGLDYSVHHCRDRRYLLSKPRLRFANRVFYQWSDNCRRVFNRWVSAYFSGEGGGPLGEKEKIPSLRERRRLPNRQTRFEMSPEKYRTDSTDGTLICSRAKLYLNLSLPSLTLRHSYLVLSLGAFGSVG